MGSSNENSAFGNVLNPWTRTRCRAVIGRFRRGSGRAHRAGGDRHRTPVLDSRAGGFYRGHRHQAHLWSASRWGMIAFASSLDTAG